MRILFDPDAPTSAAGGSDAGVDTSTATEAAPVESSGGELSGGDLAADFAAQNGGEATGSGTAEATGAGTAVADQPSGEQAASPEDQQRSAEKAQRRAEREQRRAVRDQLFAKLAEKLTADERATQPTAPQAPVWDAKKFALLQKTDPQAAIDMVLEHRILSNPQLVDKLLEGRLKPVEEMKTQLETQEHQARMRGCHAETQAKYSDFKEGTPQYGMTRDYVDKNPWIAEVAKHVPNVNMVEVAYMLATYPNVVQQLKAAQGKVVDKRATAATVKTGTGGKVSPRGTSPARLAAQDLADKGESVPDAWVKAAERAFFR